MIRIFQDFSLGGWCQQNCRRRNLFDKDFPRIISPYCQKSEINKVLLCFFLTCFEQQAQRDLTETYFETQDVLTPMNPMRVNESAKIQPVVKVCKKSAHERMAVWLLFIARCHGTLQANDKGKNLQKLVQPKPFGGETGCWTSCPTHAKELVQYWNNATSGFSHQPGTPCHVQVSVRVFTALWYLAPQIIKDVMSSWLVLGILESECCGLIGENNPYLLQLGETPVHGSFM